MVASWFAPSHHHYHQDWRLAAWYCNGEGNEHDVITVLEPLSQSPVLMVVGQACAGVMAHRNP